MNDDAFDLDPDEVSHFKRLSERLGSNPGGLHADQSGERWYLKQYQGANAEDRTRNEKLTAELYRLAGVPHADARLTEWNGRPALASRFIWGRELGEHDPEKYGAIKGLRENFPVDAWLSNYDAMGTHLNNVVVTDDGVAHRIDAGGGLRYRATGKLKTHYDSNAARELEDMRDPEVNPWIAKVFGNVKVSQDDPSFAGAVRLAQVTDPEIIQAVYQWGPPSRTAKDRLIHILAQRRDAISDEYGLRNSFVVPPVDLAAIGHGDTKAGRAILDKMFPNVAHAAGHAVLSQRAMRDLGDGDLHHGAAVIDRLIERMREAHGDSEEEHADEHD
jgi:hypothetical protein